ncbi:MAG: M48 family metallopeptidase [Bdellovibrionales bacterium]|nr:M48 family metallopeptidase [Bdellovibrionales bacterium]
MTYEWKAEYFAKGSSKATPCTIRVLGDQVFVEVDGQTHRFPLGEVEVSDRLGNIPRKVRLPDDSMVKIEDHPDIDELFGTSELNVFIHWLESHRYAVIIALASLISFSYLFYFEFLPCSAKMIASVTPQNVKEQLDKSVINSLETLKLIEPEREALIERDDYKEFIEQQLEKYPELHLKFEVIKGEEIGPNAFAIAGGTVMVTEKLIEKVGSHVYVKAILLHEIGHIYHNHVLQNIIQRMGISLFLFAVIGADDITAVPMLVMSSAYSRDLEREADHFAADALIGYDLEPSLLAKALEELTEDQPESSDTEKQFDSFTSTHPLTEERSEYLRNYQSSRISKSDQSRQDDDDDQTLKEEVEP